MATPKRFKFKSKKIKIKKKILKKQWFEKYCLNFLKKKLY